VPMDGEVCILDLADREGWCAEHSLGGLPCQSWSYCNALSASGVEPKLAVVKGGGTRMLLPFFERKWKNYADVATILGLSGASIEPMSRTPLEIWKRFATNRGWVAGYIQLAPSAKLSAPPPGDELVASNEVFLINLQQKDPLEGASQIVRRKVRWAQRCGVVLVEDRRVLARTLEDLYPSAIRRTGASDRYAFTTETLRRWATDPENLILGGRIDGTVQAVHLFACCAGYAEFQLSASTDYGRNLSAWMLWEAMVRLRAAGVVTFNIGGGIRRGDGVYEFKKKFGGIARPLQSIRQIYDIVAYR